MPLVADGPERATFESNKLLARDRSVHDWYRFVLSFPPHLVRHYLETLGLRPGSVVLDPFCGTGTTLVEAKKLGIGSLGIEANPMAQLAARVKIDWRPNPAALVEHGELVAGEALAELAEEGIADSGAPATDGPLASLPRDASRLLLTNSISPAPLHKALVLLRAIERLRNDCFYDHERVAFAQAIVAKSSNLAFGPEVGVGRPRPDAPVIGPWLDAVRSMAADLKAVQSLEAGESGALLADSRDLGKLVPAGSIDGLFTSPPYPNEKDYTRTTRLESVLLGLIPDRAALRYLKQGLVRSNTRSVYKSDDDDTWVSGFPEIQELADAIEARRIELNKTSGFERMYPRLTKLYFGGMARHLANLRPLLRPGALLAYVVGDQASYLRVMIRTGQILGRIAQSLGYEVEGIDLFRTRLSTATREQLREEVLVLRWSGG